MTGATGSVSSRPSRVPDRASATRALRRTLPPLVVFLIVLGIWEIATTGTSRRVIPAPSAIVDGLFGDRSRLQKAAWATLTEALGGLMIGTVGGVIVAFATARWVTARDLLLPIAIGASTIPLIAIAPILNNWFGVLDPFSKMTMASLLVFFPVTINVTRGLVEVPPAALELMRSYATSETEVLLMVRIPNMLPFLFTALKVGTTLAFIGAIVGEFYGGTSDVLGRVVLTAISGGRYDIAWAAILLGAVAAMICYLVVSFVERATIPWYAALRGAEA